MEFIAELKKYQEYVYNELTSLESKDKHNRVLMQEKGQQLSKLLDLIATLEDEIKKYEIMKNTHLKLVRTETADYPSCFN